MNGSRIMLAGAWLVMVTASHAQNDARPLIEEVVAAVGGIDQLRALKDVEYEYTFRGMESKAEDVSMERYIFDGEYSFAQYKQRDFFALPKMKGELTQYYSGQETVSKLNGAVISEEQPAYVGHFFRKTNFYWFTMMYKLLDPGVNYQMMDSRDVGGVEYQVIEMTFDQGVGETSDRYLLYVHPETKLVDQFLFTVKGFGFEEPFLMKLTFEEVNGLLLPTYRKYAPANWEGEVIKQDWNEQISKQIRFDNGFTPETIAEL